MSHLFKYLFVLWMAMRVRSKFFIQSLESQMVLDVANQNWCANSRVILCPRTGRSSQLWSYYNSTLIRNEFNGFFMDVEHPGKVNSEIILWPAHGGANQMWIHEPEKTLRTWKKLFMQPRTSKEGSPVFVARPNKKLNQKWEFIPYQEPGQS